MFGFVIVFCSSCVVCFLVVNFVDYCCHCFLQHNWFSQHGTVRCFFFGAISFWSCHDIVALFHRVSSSSLFSLITSSSLIHSRFSRTDFTITSRMLASSTEHSLTHPALSPPSWLPRTMFVQPSLIVGLGPHR